METKFTPSRPYWVNMPPNLTQKHRNQRISSTLNTKNPQREITRNLPSMVANSVTERNVLWIRVYHNKQLDLKNQSFPICKRNQTYNTKGCQIIPYSEQLKQIPIELFPIPLVLAICSQQQQTREACYIICCQIYSSIYNQQCISN